MTGDRDMFSARRPVKVLYVRTGGKQGAELVDAAEVSSRYGVPPELVPDFIALRGDPSDGIRAPRASGRRRRRAAPAPRLAGGGARHGVRETKKTVRAALLAGGRAARVQGDRHAPGRRRGAPPDTPTDYAGAAAAARELGMERLANVSNSLRNLGDEFSPEQACT